MVVVQLFLRLVLRWTRVKEKIVVSVAVVLDFDLLFLTIQKGKVWVDAGCLAFNAALTVIGYLRVERIMSQHRYNSHSAYRPEEESEEPLHEIKSHVLWQMILFVTDTSKYGKTTIELYLATYINLVKSLLCFKCVLKVVTRLCEYLLQQMLAHWSNKVNILVKIAA